VQAIVGPNLKTTYYAGMVEGGTEKMEGRRYMQHTRALTDDDALRIFEEGAAEAGQEIARRMT
jgi:hypothetical protein